MTERAYILQLAEAGAMPGDEELTPNSIDLRALDLVACWARLNAWKKKKRLGILPATRALCYRRCHVPVSFMMNGNNNINTEYGISNLFLQPLLLKNAIATEADRATRNAREGPTTGTDSGDDDSNDEDDDNPNNTDEESVIDEDHHGNDVNGDDDILMTE